ncbi:MAG: aminotransferase class III-fold pyridoxal phosphate-dependent enzyme, partial [Nitrosopumilus sp.]|nr:aminotransferase class III-fold pyridoxal phosphate-dependent enzyme [Nitrosopumilus sp.]
PYREAIYFDAYYRELSQLCHKHHVFLIFDETVTGYRFNHPLAQYIINCKPDFTIIGKSFANGYALSALIAEKSLMKKIEDACLEGQLFDFSTTHAGESIGLAAAIKTLEIFRRDNVIEYLNRQGLNLISHLEEILKYRNLDKKIVIKGQPTYFYLASASGWMNKELRKEIVKHFYDNGILFRGTMSLCFSHLQTHVDRICEVFDNLCMSLERSLA